jgi:hypothetical protein
LRQERSGGYLRQQRVLAKGDSRVDELQFLLLLDETGVYEETCEKWNLVEDCSEPRMMTTWRKKRKRRDRKRLDLLSEQGDRLS